jgi:hypothetical protein
MRTSAPDTTLQLLLGDAERAEGERIVLFPEIPEAAVEPISHSLLDAAQGGHRLLLPAPGPDAAVDTQRAWHVDMWRARPKADRDAVVFVAGMTAAYLAPVLGDAARTVAIIREPLDAVTSAPDRLPKLRALERLADLPPGPPPAWARRIANPQSRALLAPWHDPEKLPVSPGPAADAEHWRDALFGEILPRLDAATVEDAQAVAHGLAARLGAKPKLVVQAANAAVGDTPRGPDDAELADLLLRFNWLDAELHERCASTGVREP